MTSREYQETTVTQGRDDDYVRVWTSNPVHARKLEKLSFVIKDSGNADDHGGFYRIPADRYDVLTGFRRQRSPMTEEQRAAAAMRLKAAREAKEATK